ncbi:MAG: hypothetical protein HY306_08590 [Nitrosomonadales bacterium]|nr:hypothetical protein [Nitrosomonadales bacterium]
MSNYDLLLQFTEILTTLGGVGFIALTIWWRKEAALLSANVRRQTRREVAAERRKNERRKQVRLSGVWEHSA